MRETDFDARYRADPDPFEVASSWYERRKESVVLACLARQRYTAAWDCAAGTGHLVHALAPRCERVLATDGAVTAVSIIGARNAERPGVTAELNTLPTVPPAATGCDLVILAEILYYLPAQARGELLEALPASAGEVLLVHWRHHADDAWLSGPAVHLEAGRALEAAGWTGRVHHVDADFVLDSWVRCP
ncbi:SAM-dependent methyltransferase [Nocardioides mangrovicus]|uniref:SAM-dependent methyltransferase n=1 Tax=Nocardioides mangrovicus TaxID=2478913 RepID=A0A3L8NZY3_9ACTN|nr:class I SAM-dependent methyltransferase [Nocardioides mangrovicus]RLV48474.1 SAM-dependent methyltransferase [Nocardioides mangrovicus]